jgi:hypothetical protein
MSCSQNVLGRFSTLIPIVLCGALGAFGTGCGLILTGTTTEVPIDSEPQKASVYVDGVHVGETPLRVALDRSVQSTIVFKREGYPDRTVQVHRSVRGGFVFLDILFFIAPVVVDAATGGWYGVSPDSVHVLFDQSSEPESEAVKEEP